MKQSIRAKRLARKQKRQQQQSRLNLVSLMDIFTILVFFLLLNSSDVKILQADNSIELPKSVAEQKLETTLLVRISDSAIFVGNRVISKLSAIDKTAEQIPALKTELAYHTQRAPKLTEAQRESGRKITIMGDAKVPFHLLKQVMTTCADSDYRDIDLAVQQVPKAKLDTDSSQLKGSAARGVML